MGISSPCCACQSESQAKEPMGLRTNMRPERTGGTLVEGAWYGWWNLSPENQVTSLGINSATQWYKGIYLTPHWKFPTAQDIITFTAQRLEDRSNEPLGWDRHGLWCQRPQHLPAMLIMACSPEEHCRFTLEHGTVSGIPLQNKTVLAKTQWQKPTTAQSSKECINPLDWTWIPKFQADLFVHFLIYLVLHQGKAKFKANFLTSFPSGFSPWVCIQKVLCKQGPAQEILSSDPGQKSWKALLIFIIRLCLDLSKVIVVQWLTEANNGNRTDWNIWNLGSSSVQLTSTGQWQEDLSSSMVLGPERCAASQSAAGSPQKQHVPFRGPTQAAQTD